MARRQKRGNGKHKVKRSAKLSKSTRNNLQSSAERARRIIKTALKYGEYDGPDPQRFLLSNLLKRYDQGESIKDILREVKAITPESIRYQTPKVSETGYELTPQQYQSIVEATARANRNIEKARRKFKAIIDVMPETIKVDEIVKGVTSETTVTHILEDLKNYVPSKLIPYANPETGELFGTVAEYEFNAAKLKRENERRRREQEQLNPNTNPDIKFLRVQEVYDKEQIDISKIPTMDALRRRAATWDDLQRVQRSNMWVQNYRDTLGLLESYVKEQQIWNDTVQERFEYIKSVLDKLINNEDAVKFVSTQMPMLQISSISDIVTGYLDFDSIYNDWADFDSWFF